ncbi:helix-turn-helix domain-containing protein [Streptomyces sp. x-80]|jgi:transcriptional regulator with XRE-family HTH domain|uniref:helix-turn-helix domain-containing protein n=1 Tax=Streptomyces sp. x-80 TaxID=2789282 RepID=UPI00397FFE42
MVERDFVIEDFAHELLARELCRLRRVAGLSLAKLAEGTNYDRTYLNRLETGDRISKLPVMEALDRVYGTEGLLAGLWKLARQDAFKDTYQLFMQHEAKAVIMHKYVMNIPGLLQTEAYARTVMSSSPAPIGPERLEELVAIRLGRQEMLRRDPPPSFRFLLDESALRRPTPDRKIWHDQLVRLLDASEERNITIQVLPFTAGDHDLLGGSLTLLWKADGSTVAYLEGNKSGGLVEDPEKIARHRMSYEYVRDLALSPLDSAAFIQQLVEDSKP